MQARQAAALGDRHQLRKLGIAVVHDIGPELGGHLGVVAGARGIAAQGIEDTDLDRLLGVGLDGQCQRKQRSAGSKRPANHPVHLQAPQ
jgi:hypothetical protein